MATLLDTRLQALLTNVAILSKKKTLSAFLTALLHNVSDVCLGIDKVNMKGVFWAAQKLNIRGASMLSIAHFCDIALQSSGSSIQSEE